MIRPRLALSVAPSLLLAAVALAPSAPAVADRSYAGPLCFGRQPTLVVDENQDGVGTPGDDVIYARPWSAVHGLGGDDLICGSLVARGGAGDDRIEFVGGAEFEVADLRGGPGDDVVRARTGQPGTRAHGGPGDDRLVGGTGPQLLHGGRGDDLLLGRAGDDRLLGGAGDDRLSGGAGTDAALGGRGSDDCDRAEIVSSCES